jgi:hypothetical protein
VLAAGSPDCSAGRQGHSGKLGMVPSGARRKVRLNYLLLCCRYCQVLLRIFSSGLWALCHMAPIALATGSDIHVCAVKTVRWNGQRVHLDRESLRVYQVPGESWGVSQVRRCAW